MNVRLLEERDRAAVDAFLSRHAPTSMFLRANIAGFGIADGGDVLHGTYAAAYGEGGEIRAVGAHYRNGMVIVQAPARAQDAAEVARAAVEGSRRPVTGFAGAHAQVTAAREGLGLSGRPAPIDSFEVLFVLSLADLVLPPELSSPRVVCRRPREEELELLTEWRVRYSIETLGSREGPELREQARGAIARAQAERRQWVLEHDGRLVAYTGFNAVLPDMAQIGGVFTPPAERRRHYARAAVAGSLVDARNEGVRTAVLFTEDTNVAAQRAYIALGFQRAGDYALVLFE